MDIVLVNGKRYFLIDANLSQATLDTIVSLTSGFQTLQTEAEKISLSFEAMGEKLSKAFEQQPEEENPCDSFSKFSQPKQHKGFRYRG